MMDAFITFARYNRKMNAQIYDVCAQLDQGQLEADRGAFFGSIYCTLNHIMIADLYWLQRVTKQPSPLVDSAGEPLRIQALDQILYEQLATLSHWRSIIDDRIVACVEALAQESADLSRTLDHRLMDGSVVQFTLNKALCHWFNHQTHHRGQVTTILSQLHIDFGVTDLLLMELD
ncbi:DinB family protein [Ketobacter alkanivorans]|uniref:Damage-inducible protein DinB n=1 Tax=Ketobacter alkanivorans TaxID=1917421 RepID=A0A2K9LLQ7_9GAMM|nr:DinB family protein [Ketobacter alkanivorans]AUM13286.1 hypothetical protein Kalk_13015 [Ketobacter alkanivorans]